MENRWDLVGKIKSSKWRFQILRTLSHGAKTPMELSREIGISSSHISELLTEMAGLELIECINPTLRKGKLYSITQLGTSILLEIK